MSKTLLMGFIFGFSIVMIAWVVVRGTTISRLTKWQEAELRRTLAGLFPDCEDDDDERS